MIIVADNLRITLPAIGRAVNRLDPRTHPADGQACHGCRCPGHRHQQRPNVSATPEEKMTFLVRTVQECVDLPIVLDTANPRAMAAGLAASRDKAIINGVSWSPEKLERILPMARQHDCDIIGYLLRPNGHVPVDASGRMEAAVALFDAIQTAGIQPERIIIDPVVAPLAWQDGNRQNMAVLEVIRTLPDLLGFPVRTIAGLSNLTTGAPDPDTRRRYQCAFLAHARRRRPQHDPAKCARSCRYATVFSWH
jgi:5-methyltetrahydrofolate corrinoid/iron sulfur protein methyltransferase